MDCFSQAGPAGCRLADDGGLAIETSPGFVVAWYVLVVMERHCVCVWTVSVTRFDVTCPVRRSAQGSVPRTVWRVVVSHFTCLHPVPRRRLTRLHPARIGARR